MFLVERSWTATDTQEEATTEIDSSSSIPATEQKGHPTPTRPPTKEGDLDENNVDLNDVEEEEEEDVERDKRKAPSSAPKKKAFGRANKEATPTPASSADKQAPLERKAQWGFRAVPWCVDGESEPEFRRYPYSAFKMFLDRSFEYTPLSTVSSSLILSRNSIVDKVDDNNQ
jgi:hypothetical protein